MSGFSAVMKALPGKESAVVIGAGAIGLEAAAALRTHCRTVSVVEMEQYILPGVLDPDMAEDVRMLLESDSIAFHLGEPADDVFFDGEFRGVSVSGKRVEADIGICAAGTVPNTGLVKGTGIECGSYGIRVNRRMRTNVESIFAAGDCAETISVIDGNPLAAKLASSAWLQGTAAALSMAGLEKDYAGSAGTFVTRPGRLEIAGTGFTTAAASERGYDPVMAKIMAQVRPEYMNNNKTVTVKVIADRETGMILGAQAFGEGAAASVNLVSEALFYGASLETFLSVELAYCPAVSKTVCPLMRAAEGALRRIRR
jgi:NADH oxidase (H2O2-forming)